MLGHLTNERSDRAGSLSGSTTAVSRSQEWTDVKVGIRQRPWGTKGLWGIGADVRFQVSDNVCLQPVVEEGRICLPVLKQSHNYVSRFGLADRRSAADQTDVGSSTLRLSVLFK